MKENKLTFCKINEICSAEQQVKKGADWGLLLIGNTIALLGFQVLLFWIGSCFPEAENLGLYLDIGLTFLVGLPLFFVIFRDKSAYAWSALLFAVATVGIYICMTVFCAWWLEALSFIIILISFILGEKEKLNPFVLYGTIAFYLLYACCTWGAMTLMEVTPAADLWQWSGLSVITLIVWFIPLISKKTL